MSNIIPFRTREELDQEKKKKYLEEWDEYLEFEKKALEQDAEWLERWVNETDSN